MTGEPRTADVVATSDVECFRLGKDTFEQVLLARPEIATELSEKLATRRVELMASARASIEREQTRARRAKRERILGGIKASSACEARYWRTMPEPSPEPPPEPPPQPSPEPSPLPSPEPSPGPHAPTKSPCRLTCGSTAGCRRESSARSRDCRAGCDR